MSRLYDRVVSFATGEISPLMMGRVDFEKYPTSCKTLENFIVTLYGSAFYRPGTYYVGEVKDSSKKIRLIPFQFSTVQSYVIECGDKYMRFYKDHARIESGGSPYELATPWSTDELFDLYFAQSADVVYICHPDYMPRKLSRTGHTAWTMEECAFKGGPFRDDNLDDTWTITPSATTGSITLTANKDTWTANHVGAIWKIGGKTGTPSLQGYVEITAYTDAKTVTADVVQTLDGTSATDDWAEGAWSDERGYPGCVTFHEQRLCFSGAKGEPRFVRGSRTFDPEDFTAGSDDDNAFAYQLGTNEVNAVKILSSGKYLEVGTGNGMFNLKTTSSNEPITPSNFSIKFETAYGAEGVIPVRIGSYLYYVDESGIAIREFAYDFNTDIFLSQDMNIYSDHITGKGITQVGFQRNPYSLMWSVREDGEMAIFTRLVTQKTMAWSRLVTDGEYESVAIIPNGSEHEVWVSVKRNINGVTKRYIEYFKPFKTPDNQEDVFHLDCGITYDERKTVEGITNATEAVVTLTGHGYSNGDEVKFFNVKGMTEVNLMKYQVSDVTTNTFKIKDVINGSYIDTTSYGTFSTGGSPTVGRCVKSISGLGHLEGKEVDLCVDGSTYPKQTVSSGAITLSTSYAVIHIGIPYQGTLEPAPLEKAVQLGSAQPMLKNVYYCMIRLNRSLGGSIGDENTQDELLYYSLGVDEMGFAVPLFTGDKEIHFPGGWSKDSTIKIIQNKPLPFHVLGIFPEIDITQ